MTKLPQATAATARASGKRQPLHPIQRLTAERMMASHLDSAHVTIHAEAEATALLELHGALKERFRPHDIKISLAHILVKIAAQALRIHPDVNVQLEAEELVYSDSVHISMALSTASGQLIAPVIQNADEIPLEEIARRSAEFKKLADAKKLRPQALQGGTFTISNLGMFPAVIWTTPLINPPQCAIMGVGSIRERMRRTERGFDTAHVIGLSLTHDHRILNGYPAAAFMQTVADLIAAPSTAVSG